MKSKTTQRASAILMAIITALAAVFTLPSCTGFDGDGVTFPGINLPIDIGVVYPLEDGLAIQVGPAEEVPRRILNTEQQDGSHLPDHRRG